MMDAGHSYMPVIYSTMIYPYNAGGRDLYGLLECEGWHKRGYNIRDVHTLFSKQNDKVR